VKRREALEIIDEVFHDRPLVVTCGAPARDLASIARRDSHLYLLDSMGLAAAVGAGLALAGRGPLASVEGDGSLLMGFSVLPTICALAPPGLTLVVLDNHEHASADRIPTHAAVVSLGAACRGTGLLTFEVDDGSGLRSALADARAASGPTAVITRIEGGNDPDVPLLLEDPVTIGDRFRWFLSTQEGER
jgi:sulfopyruvate decarboxylase subunit beta